MKEKVKFITVGIRYKRTFAIANTSGAIIDKVLKDSALPFGRLKSSDDEGELVETKNNGSILSNPNTKEYFAVDIDNIVLRISVIDFVSTFQKIKEVYIPYISNSIFDVFGLSEITRIGIIFELQDKDLPHIEKIATTITSEQIKNVIDANIRFTYRLPEASGVLNGDKNYFNVISTLIKSEGKYTMNLDFQRYFDPTYESMEDIDFEAFFDRAETHLNGKFLKSTHEE